ncbi:MAG: LamG domain-containing protein [Methanoregula sp.]|jgi:hypothetical protein|nr:LamG domain-containing protein [Methanoregula sp.]
MYNICNNYPLDRELLKDCIAAYDLSTYQISGSTAYNIINPGTYDGTISNCSYGTDRFGISSNALKCNESGYNSSSGVAISKSVEHLGAKTVLMWIYLNALNVQQYIYDTYKASSANHGWGIYITGSNNIIQIVSGKGTSGTPRVQLNFVGIPNAWAFIGFSWDGTTNSNTVKAYLNGINTYSGTAISTETTTQTSNIRLFGYNLSTTKGYTENPINFIAFWNRAIDDTEIMRLYSTSQLRHLIKRG